MIKKIFSLFLICTICLILTGCGKEKLDNDNKGLPINETISLINIYELVGLKDNKVIVDRAELETIKEIFNRAEKDTTGCKNRCANEVCTYHCASEYESDPDYTIELLDKDGVFNIFDIWLYDFHRAYITYYTNAIDQTNKNVRGITHLLTPEDTITFREIMINAPVKAVGA